MNVQGDQLNMAVYFWYLVKSDVKCTLLYSIVHWSLVTRYQKYTTIYSWSVVTLYIKRECSFLVCEYVWLVFVRMGEALLLVTRGKGEYSKVVTHWPTHPEIERSKPRTFSDS